MSKLLFISLIFAILYTKSYGFNRFSILNHEPPVPKKTSRSDSAKWDKIEQFVDNFNPQNHDIFEMVFIKTVPIN